MGVCGLKGSKVQQIFGMAPSLLHGFAGTEHACPPGHSLGWMEEFFPRWQAGARPHPSLSSCFADKQVDLHLLAVLQSVSVVAAVAWGSQGDVLGVSMVSLALSCREGRAAVC